MVSCVAWRRVSGHALLTNTAVLGHVWRRTLAVAKAVTYSMGFPRVVKAAGHLPLVLHVVLAVNVGVGGMAAVLADLHVTSRVHVAPRARAGD